MTINKKINLTVIICACFVLFFVIPILAVEDNQSDDSQLSFVVISHMHKSLTNPSFGAFERAVDKINDIEPDFVMFLGDYIWGFDDYIADWNKFNSIADKIGTEKFMIAGNHELTERPNDKLVSDQTKLEYYQENVGDLYYSFIKNNNLFIALNSFNFYNGNLRDNIDSDQLEFLKQNLEQSGEYQNVFIFTHQCSWLEFDNNWYSDVVPIIRDKVDYVICGTKDTFYYTEVDGITYVMSGMAYKQVYNKSFFIHVIISDSGKVEMFPILIDDGNFLELPDFYLDENIDNTPAVINYSQFWAWIDNHTKLITVGIAIILFLLGLFIGKKSRKI